MLIDTKLRNLKLRDKRYKVNDRDSMYVAVTAVGTVSFHYNYSFNERQETITFGRYGIGGSTLTEAREQLSDTRRASPQPRRRPETRRGARMQRRSMPGRKSGCAATR